MTSRNTVTKQDVIARLRAIFERAVKNYSGVSYFLSEEEQALLDDTDIQKIEDESGYTEMCNNRTAFTAALASNKKFNSKVHAVHQRTSDFNR